MENSLGCFLLSSPTIKELTEHVDVSTNWYIVGTMLDLDQKRLRSIEAQTGHNDTHKMIEMFNLWLTTTPNASRRQVLNVLRIKVVGENTLADEYERYLRKLHETSYHVSQCTQAVSILQKKIQSLNEALVSPVQVSQLLYCKRCISEATLDEMERIDQRRSMDEKKTTLLTAMQETVSSDYRKLKDIATVLSDVEVTRDIANEIMSKYEEKISQDDNNTLVQLQEVLGGNEDRASDILRNNYSALSLSIIEPVRVARLLHEEVISDEALSCVMSTRSSLSDSRAVLLKAVRGAVHSNYKHLELFVTVLRKFSETAHIGDTIFEEYKYKLTDNYVEEMETYLTEKKGKSQISLCASSNTEFAEDSVILGHQILFPRDMRNEFKNMRVKFGSTFYDVRLLFAKKWGESQSDINNVKALLIDIFPDLRAELSVAKTIDGVLDVVKRKCSIIDIRPLEVLAQKFEVKEAEAIIREHKEAAEKFCKSVSVDLFQDQTLQVIPTRHLLCETITFVLNWNPDETTLQDINDVLLELELLYKYSIKVVGVSSGRSVVVTCYCPAEYTSSLITAVLDKIEILQKRGLKEFIIGNSTVWNTQVVTDLLVQINDLKAALKDRDETIMATEIELATLKEKSESRLKEIEALQIDLEESRCIKVQNEEKINKLKQKILLQKRKIIDIEKSESLLDQLLEDAEKELESLKELSEKRLQEIEKLKLKLKKNNDSLAEQESTEASDTDTSIQEDEDVKWFQNGVRLFNPSLDSCKEVISKLEDKHEIMVLIASPSVIIQFLIPTILERKAIKQLTIYSSLTPEDILSFSSELSTNKSLTSLQIIHNSISDDGVFVLAEALQYNETLQYLYLNDNPDITSASAQSLAKLFMLSCLNLDNTNIDPNEVMDLMESLRTNNIQ